MTTVTVQIPNNQVDWFEQMIQSMGWNFRKEVSGPQGTESHHDTLHTDFPCTYTLEQAKAITLQRGRDIVAGKDKLIPHEEVMGEMDQLIASYAD